MNTPSHFLMTAAICKILPRCRIARGAALLGSVAPDLPLYALTFGGFYYFGRIRGWSSRQTASHMFDTLYFEDPWWIASHSLLHSPVSLLLGLAMARILARRLPVAANRLHWFLVACLFHSSVDIATHHDDGPILLWPLNWTLRFYSPVS